MENKIASLGNRGDKMEERISDIEHRSLEINHKEERDRRMKNNEREI